MHTQFYGCIFFPKQLSSWCDWCVTRKRNAYSEDRRTLHYELCVDHWRKRFNQLTVASSISLFLSFSLIFFRYCIEACLVKFCLVNEKSSLSLINIYTYFFSFARMITVKINLNLCKESAIRNWHCNHLISILYLIIYYNLSF